MPRLTPTMRWIAPAAMLLTLFAVGCGSPYINIPPQRGDVASHEPNGWTVRKVVAAAVAHAHEANDVTGEYILLMPDGTVTDTYLWVAKRLPDGVQLPGESTAPVSFEAAQIRVRGIAGEVDIIEILPGAPPRLRTVYVRRDTAGWYADRDYVWAAPVEKALRQALGESDI